MALGCHYLDDLKAFIVFYLFKKQNSDKYPLMENNIVHLIKIYIKFKFV